MLEWMLMPYRRYADFSGRSRRKEYWMFTLFSVIVSIVLLGLMFGGMGGIDETTGEPQMGVLSYVGIGLFALWGLGSLIPSIAVQVRRRVIQHHRVLNLMAHVDPAARPDADHLALG